MGKIIERVRARQRVANAHRFAEWRRDHEAERLAASARFCAGMVNGPAVRPTFTITKLEPEPATAPWWRFPAWFKG